MPQQCRRCVCVCGLSIVKQVLRNVCSPNVNSLKRLQQPHDESMLPQQLSVLVSELWCNQLGVFSSILFSSCYLYCSFVFCSVFACSFDKIEVYDIEVYDSSRKKHRDDPCYPGRRDKYGNRGTVRTPPAPVVIPEASGPVVMTTGAFGNGFLPPGGVQGLGLPGASHDQR